METFVTRAGYHIKKSDCTQQDIAAIKRELVVAPVAPGGKTYGGGEVPTFPIYTESATHYILPKYWAVERWGPAAHTYLDEGEAMAPMESMIALRPQQEAIVSAFMTVKQGLICVPCGVGKTCCAIHIAHTLGLKTLVVVHKHFLLNQWIGEIQRFLPDAKIGTLYADKVDIKDKDIVVVMLQSIVIKGYPPEYFDGFGFTIFDECHHLGAEVFSRAFKTIHTRYMLGLSATPNRQDGLEKIFYWHIGPIAYEAKRKDLFVDDRIRVLWYKYECDDEEYAAEPKIYTGEPNRAAIITNVASYGPRNEYILECVTPFLQEGRQMLMLSDRKDQLKYIFETIPARPEVFWKINDEGAKVPVTVGYYVGGMKQAALDASARCDVVLGTYAMASEAMNIPTLERVCFLTAKGDVEQSVGRMLRKRMEDRDCMHICLDFIDQHDCFRNQHRKRKAFYKANNYDILEIKMDDTSRFNMNYLLKPFEALPGPKKTAAPTEIPVWDFDDVPAAAAAVAAPAVATPPAAAPTYYATYTESMKKPKTKWAKLEETEWVRMKPVPAHPHDVFEDFDDDDDDDADATMPGWDAEAAPKWDASDFSMFDVGEKVVKQPNVIKIVPKKVGTAATPVEGRSVVKVGTAATPKLAEGRNVIKVSAAAPATPKPAEGRSIVKVGSAAPDIPKPAEGRSVIKIGAAAPATPKPAEGRSVIKVRAAAPAAPKPAPGRRIIKIADDVELFDTSR